MTLKSYLIGFIASLLLTMASFFLVASKLLPEKTLVYTIVVLAITQAIVQLFFFLHLGKEAKPRYEALIFYFMLLVLLVLVAGSLWIMFNLNDRLMMDMR